MYVALHAEGGEHVAAHDAVFQLRRLRQQVDQLGPIFNPYRSIQCCLLPWPPTSSRWVELPRLVAGQPSIRRLWLRGARPFDTMEV